MCNLLRKELRLAAHPSLYMFMAMGALVLIPAYPYGVVFFFGGLGVFQTVMFGRETRDVFYTALLPVRKGDGVRGKILLAVFSQLTQLALSLPFAFLRTLYMAEGNPAGIEANAAYYGFGLMLYGMFNLVFFTRFYRTAYRAGTSFLMALIPLTLGIATMEVAVHFPGMGWLDSVAGPDLVRQIPILVLGVLVYIASNLLACRLGARNFSRVDL